MQPSIFDVAPRIDGPGITHADQIRLASQHDRVLALMRDGRFRTLKEIALLVRGSEAGVSARLRDLRKVRWGAWTVTRRRISHGVFVYQVTR